MIDENSFNPTQKPLSYIENGIKTFTNKGDLVLDNSKVDGNTCLDGKLLNLRFISIKKEEKYFDLDIAIILKMI